MKTRESRGLRRFTTPAWLRRGGFVTLVLLAFCAATSTIWSQTESGADVDRDATGGAASETVATEPTRETATEATTETRASATTELAPSAVDVQFFQQQVRPILADNCFKCHGVEKQRGGLRLDHRTFLLTGGDLGPAIDLESHADSQLLRAIRYEDLEMPPDGKLTADQIATLEEWVRRGAPWTPGETPAAAKEASHAPVVDDAPHWAYQPLRDVRPPTVASSDKSLQIAGPVTHPIDRFIEQRLLDAGLVANSPATPRTLVRRLHYDLLGLPPSQPEIDAFLEDASEVAYEQYLDHLLSRPEYGEHWGRHWLDIVRYAETNGYERDGRKANAWRYRDYVIQAFNSGMPYDRFVREQLAGDELPDGDSQALVATGYYRLGLWDDEPADAEQAYYDSLDDVVSTTGLVFLGTTVGCARCHDHKIDPIPQRDYYRMLAFFHNIYKDIRDSGLKKSAFTLNTQTEVATPQEHAQHAMLIQQHQAQLDRLQATVDQCEAVVFKSFSNPEKEDAADATVRRQMIRKRAADVLSPEELLQYEESMRELRRLKRGEVPALAQALTVRENGREAPETYILVRGSAHAPGDSVTPGFPAILGGQDAEIAALPESIPSSGRRTALANWLVDGRNPLVARVIVNRVWQYHFGRGLVRSSSDFGRYGDAPTHPELLDYLASELVRHDWQLKWLHRFIMTSRAYRMSSQDNPAALAVDPTNNLLWRFDMRRLSAEELRDTVLAVTGQLNAQMYGPSVYSKIPDEVLQSSSRPEDAWGTSSPADQVRRSVYVHVKRSIADPVLISFDSADTDGSCPVRFATTVPTQSLTTLNGMFFNEQSQVLADRLHREGHHDEAAFVTAALQLATSRPVTAAEVARGTQLLRDWQTIDSVSRQDAERFFCLLALNLNELLYLD